MVGKPHQAVGIYELADPSYGEASHMHIKAKVQVAILMDCQKRWCHEY